MDIRSTIRSDASRRAAGRLPNSRKAGRRFLKGGAAVGAEGRSQVSALHMKLRAGLL
jgi:hypothetical protein